jgi:predicted  nucleic acid-binding Zn-ribbon protein
LNRGRSVLWTGAAYSSDNGDCLEEAKVKLMKEAEAEAAVTTTDNYGDFEFEGIDKGSTYTLRIEAEGYYPVTIENIDVRRDIVLNEIVLQKMT